MIKKILNNKPLLNLLIYGVGQGFNLITPILVVPYLVSICGQERFGKISVGMAISFFLIVVIDYGSDINGVKDVAVNRNNKQALTVLLSTAYAARMLLLIAIIAVTSLLFISVPYFSNEKQLFFLCLSIVAGQCISPIWVFQGIEHFKWTAIINILCKVLYALGVFIFIKQPHHYIYVCLLWGMGMIVAYGIGFAALCRTYKISLKRTSVKQVQDYLKQHFSIFSSQIFLSLQLYAPVMLISFFIGDAMAGTYKILEHIIVIFRTYIFLFFNYAYPRVCYLLEQSTSQALRFWKTYNLANFIFIALCMGMLYIMAVPVACYFTHTPFNQPDELANNIATMLRVAIFFPLTLAISTPLKQLLLGYGKQKYYVNLTLGIVFLNMAAMVILIPLFKIYGVLLSLIVTEIVTIVLYLPAIKNKQAGAN
ncbi:oligosaccharide flippase family protein [Flavobacterium sp. Sd200]|uniref:oligosaccharide flippase family protein n=1 Tax=Flavobacterium sp. Sd200 TaxID=2692211 RepID=UPI00137104C6|nr:oligosaccharide flippase family protein [Flavobacterium sp. Sd200]MXN92578.1 oligosaccharide flippase family protein [Flavobacterium sp. Sd200]